MKLKILLAALLTTSSLFAADFPPHQQAGVQTVGVSAGFVKPSGADITDIPGRFGYGVEYNYSLMSELSVGAFASRSKDEIAPDSTVDFGITQIGADVKFSPVVDTFVSLRAGLAIVDVSTRIVGLTLSDDTNMFFVAPGAGIVFPITANIQVVPEFHYNFFMKTDDMPNFQSLDAMATLRYMF